MSEPIVAAIIGGAFGVTGSLLGVLAGSIISRRTSNEAIARSHENAIDIMQRQDFNSAAAQFRNAFLGAILFLRDNIRIKGTGTSDKIDEFLGTLIFMHMEALTIFESFLNATERKRIHCVWDEYCHPKGIPQNPNEKRDFRFNYYKIIEEAEGAEKAKEVALQKIYKMLEFADFK